VLIPLWFRDQDDHELSTWFNLTPDLFDSWRAQRPTGIEEAQKLAPQDTSKKTSAAESFLKGVRRNVADYTKFKEAKQWQRWERHLQSTASAQGIENVFDSAYAPTTPEDQALFNEQQKFGYQVLEQAVQTSEGMVIVREYSKTKDAQAVYKKLQEQ
jgi:hypothetical protein